MEPAELTGKRERLGTERDGGSVLAIRDVLLSPSLLPGPPGPDADDAGDPPPLPELREALNKAWANYWAGDFGPLVATAPGLITETRLTHRSVGVSAAGAVAQAYQLASSLMEHFGKMDLAAPAAEKRLEEARGMSPVWFRHQLSASRSWRRSARGRHGHSQVIRSLAHSVGLD